jgi:GDPmannose 4,6-dehydratase
MMDCFELGNLDAQRDWGHAKDYVRAMHLMLQQDAPLDLVVASGQKHSVREFVELAFQCVGRTIIWSGTGLEEVGIEQGTGTVRVRVNAKYFRPSEVVSGGAAVMLMVLRVSFFFSLTAVRPLCLLLPALAEHSRSV